MVDYSSSDTLQRRRSELRQAVFDCRARKLSEASRWASLQLQGMKKPEVSDLPANRSFSSAMEQRVDLSDAYDVAISYFDSRVREMNQSIGGNTRLILCLLWYVAGISFSHAGTGANRYGTRRLSG